MGALNGKVAIVTGAGQGVGRCHAELLAAEGAAVVVNDLGESADEVAASIVAAGGRCVAQRGSVTDWSAAQALVQRAIDEFGDLDILVNNAGFIRDGMSFSMEEQQFDSVVGVHLKGHFAPAHFAAVHWRNVAKEMGEGAVLPARRIIMTTSESGLFGGPAQSNYGSAKGGILTMTLVLARELSRYNVTVNCIAPRARTPMTQVNPKFAQPSEGFDKYDPANISPMVAFLASDAASDINAQTFIVLGDQVHRMRPAEIANSISGGGQKWTVEGLIAAKDEMFGGMPSGIPVWGGPPM
ncbi:MAG: SDR family NAD(P)-dependent oxidoreductase [Ilumatobacteraceae bacterium]|nr:SDR family NAD(P)-dependent oxidoreductase [Ilumatobacteraceae bacterium]MBJ7508989.1 SDR family NAD(P)-dependent oxidoreductase [Ilumatobacteraceae bacterium]MCX6534586.1 SDR family NAD(P)-dependent oxidoreductase [Actinomycetota bacterium]